ncbi:MAG: two-component system response regulator RppA [bacterium]|nr:two-component system response regulator RppA [bacterium]
MKILIVEDEEKLAKSIKKGLEKEGHAADYVLDGESAQTRIELHHEDYDLVILDLMLPKRDGLVVCQNIREKNLTIPILVLTAKGDVNDKIEVLDKGADDYLVKPFSFEELMARIRALMRRPTEALPIELKLKTLTLNTSTRKVYRNGKEINLTLKEFNLLEYLMRHPNQVLTREQILSNLWDFDFDSFSNIIDVHIKNLRKKIDTGNGQKLLETIYGVGYRIKG